MVVCRLVEWKNDLNSGQDIKTHLNWLQVSDMNHIGKLHKTASKTSGLTEWATSTPEKSWNNGEAYQELSAKQEDSTKAHMKHAGRHKRTNNNIWKSTGLIYLS